MTLVLRTRSSHTLAEPWDASFGFKNGITSIELLIDSEVRTNTPLMLTNFEPLAWWRNKIRRRFYSPYNKLVHRGSYFICRYFGAEFLVHSANVGGRSPWRQSPDKRPARRQSGNPSGGARRRAGAGP